MNEFFDYSLLDDQPVSPDFMGNSGSSSSLRREHLWPYGQMKLTMALSDTHAIAFIEPTQEAPGITAIATTPTGIFRLRYTTAGVLDRVRVRATNMIIEGCDHIAADPEAKLHAKNMKDSDDAILNIFPEARRMTVQNYGFTLEEPIPFVSAELWGAGVDLPQFPDIRFAVIYSETYFSFSTLFSPDKKFAETFITSRIHIPKTLFLEPNDDTICDIGCDILGLQRTGN